MRKPQINKPINPLLPKPTKNCMASCPVEKAPPISNAIYAPEILNILIH